MLFHGSHESHDRARKVIQLPKMYPKFHGILCLAGLLVVPRPRTSVGGARTRGAWDTHRETRLEQIAFPGTEGDSVGDSIEHIGTRGVDVGGDVDVMVINDARIDL